MRGFINGREYNFEDGETILQVARRNGIFIPTLCNFQPLDHKPATCRVCLAEIQDEQGSHIVTSCDTRMEEGMRVDTRSKRVRDMQRLQVEMVFADHNQDCSSCARHGSCELQDLAEAVGLTTNRFNSRLLPEAVKRPLDDSAFGMTRDMSKCIRCLRCVEVCRKVQGVAALTVDGKGVDACIGVGMFDDHQTSACIQCGQCILVCPTGALAERDQNDTVMDWIDDPEITTVFSFAPAVRVLLGEEFGFTPGTSNVEGKIIAALRRLGADVIIDTNFGADVVIMEEASELLDRIQHGGQLPMFTSCCPGWVNYAEKHCPDILPYVSTTRSPQGVLGALTKSYLAERMNLDPAKMRAVSIMPCVAKKDEAARPELARDGVPDVDLVITTREFARLLKRNGIHLPDLAPEPFDNPFLSDFTGAAAIFGSTGGVMEAAVRTAYAFVNDKEMDHIECQALRGMDGVREAEVDLGKGGKVKVAICHGLRNAEILAQEVLKGSSPYTFIEVMACPGGCVDGGGGTRFKGKYHPGAEQRQQALYTIDRSLPRRQSHKNPQLKKMYADYLGKPLSHKAHELLHTGFTDRSRSPSQTIADNKERLTLTE